ncbi:MAG: hypothetical protein ABSB25_07645 [Sedimentisphaerales bacterium]|jgi:hypothetical protein
MKARVATQTFAEAGGLKEYPGLVLQRTVAMEYHFLSNCMANYSGNRFEEYLALLEKAKNSVEGDVVNDLDSALQKFSEYIGFLGFEWMFNLKISKTEDGVLIMGDAYVRE